MPSKPRARPGAATRPKANTRGGAPAQERELRAQGQKTMRKLLEAGRVVFERRGFHAARVDDVVKRARTSHGTFYLYFANKEDLFKALAVDAIEEMSAVAKEMPAVTPDAKGYADLEKWMGRLMDAYSRHGTVIRAWTEGEIADSDLGALGLGLLTTMAGSLASHVQSDDEHFEPQIAGIALLAMIERCNYFVQSRQLRFEREALVSTLSSLVFAGCFAPQAMAAAREGARKRG